jgi:hypothetical protein
MKGGHNHKWLALTLIRACDGSHSNSTRTLSRGASPEGDDVDKLAISVMSVLGHHFIGVSVERSLHREFDQQMFIHKI